MSASISNFPQKVWDLFYYYFFRGGELLGEGWDGDDCHYEVPHHTKQLEVILWTLLILFLFQCFRHHKTFMQMFAIGRKISQSEHHHRLTSFEHFLDQALFVSLAFTSGMIIYYKILMRYMIYLLQPCHMTLIFHTFTFINVDRLGPFASLLWLPMTAGTMSAMIFPSTSALTNPYEVEVYWMEHILIQIVPLYLLVRRRGVLLKYFEWNHVFLGNLVVMCLHWWIFEAWNAFFKVNVNFFSCPTPELREAFVIFNNALPDSVKLPSYRNFYMFIFIVGSILSCFLYTTAATMLLAVLSKLRGDDVNVKFKAK